jgi:hypothetical protein
MKRVRRNKRHQLTVPVIVAAGTVILLALSAMALLLFRNANPHYGFARSIPEEEQQLRLKLVEAAESWLGSNEQDNSHKDIIDFYNQQDPLPQGYQVKYTDEWCATFVSAAALKAELTQIIPTECGCQRQIGLFQEIGSWEEADDYLPLPGDIIYYSRNNQDPFKDCIGWADHVGIVVGTSGNRIKVIEGNYGDKVDYRYLKVDATIIRGFGIPDYRSLAE